MLLYPSPINDNCCWLNTELFEGEMALANSQGSRKFDFIVVGAGSAGCVIANRLSADAKHKVLLVEAGGKDNNINIKIPLMVVNLLKNPKFIWPFVTEPQAALKNRVQAWTRGRVLGGSSSINGNVYVRGDPVVFDSWAKEGCPDWGWDDMLPFFKRLETYKEGDAATRGHSGPVGVTNLKGFDALADGYVDACGEAGYEIIDDYNDGRYKGASYLQYSTRRGFRASSSASYLKPIRDRQNLDVWTDALVTKVVISKGAATGIECIIDGETITAHCTKEVILSAGPIQSPKLLELSGIGSPDILGKYGIPVLHNLPGVGENLSDHPNTRLTFMCSKPITINDVLQSPIAKIREGLKYLFFGKGLLSICSATAHAFTKSTPEETSPDLKIQLQPFSGKDRYARRPQDGLDPHSGFTVGVMALKPKSRGWVHIASSDPEVYPKIDPKYLDESSDAQVLLAGIKEVRRVVTFPSLKKLVVKETRPGPEVDDDEKILDYILETTQTTWHAVGTCKMGTDKNAVVDTKLAVHGIKQLRVADSSVFPTIPSSNTNAPTIALGERAAEIILNKWSDREEVSSSMPNSTR